MPFHGFLDYPKLHICFWVTRDRWDKECFSFVLYCGFFSSSLPRSSQIHDLLQLRLTQSRLSSPQHQTTSPGFCPSPDMQPLAAAEQTAFIFLPGNFTSIPTYLCPHISKQKVRKMLILKEQYRFSLKVNQEIFAVCAFQSNKTFLV